MIVDSSAIIALLAGEEHAEAVAQALETGFPLRMGAPTALEVALVADHRGSTIARERFDDLLAQFEVVTFDARDAATARAAHERYGRGSGSPARLNYGDCMSYAIARRLGEPLLYVGEDFAATDIDSVL